MAYHLLDPCGGDRLLINFPMFLFLAAFSTDTAASKLCVAGYQGEVSMQDDKQYGIVITCAEFEDDEQGGLICAPIGKQLVIARATREDAEELFQDIEQGCDSIFRQPEQIKIFPLTGKN